MAFAAQFVQHGASPISSSPCIGAVPSDREVDDLMMSYYGQIECPGSMFNQLALAAAGETLRFLSDAADGAAAVGVTMAEWECYHQEILKRYGVWCDVETVASQRCDQN